VISTTTGYTPLIADIAFCWGEQHRARMTALGTAAERLVVAGCQRLRRELPVDVEATRRRLALPPGPIALLATSPGDPSTRAALLDGFASMLAGSGVAGVVRLHPSESPAGYEAWRERLPGGAFLPPEVSLEEALGIADVVVCHESGFANDALIKRRPVVVFCPPPLALGLNGRDLIDNAGCPLAGDATSLRREVLALLQDPMRRAVADAAAERYVGQFCARFGDDAARFIAATVARRLAAPERPTAASHTAWMALDPAYPLGYGAARMAPPSEGILDV
jgi:hypothetical protein